MKTKIFCVTKRKKRPAGRAVMSVLGIAGMMAALTVVTVALSFFSTPRWLSREQLLFGGCLATAAFGIWLAFRAGRSYLQDVMVFFRDEDGRLYVKDARQSVIYRRGIFGYMQMEKESAQEKELILRQLERDGVKPAGAAEILKVESIREHRYEYVLSCRVRYSHGAVGKYTCFLVKGEPDERELLWELERRKSWQGLEPQENRGTVYILIGLTAFLAVTVICVMSHPATAFLPEALYFPCLGMDLVLVWILGYLVVKWRRGE